MDKNDNLCKGCDDYNHNEDKCNLLLSLHTLSALKHESAARQDQNPEKRSGYIEQLLFHPRCMFSRYILSFAGRFASKRALNSHESSDIHNDIVCSLMKLDFRKIQPTFKDFRRYVTKMIKSAVHHEHAKTYGPYRCGTCTFFLDSDQCGCPDLKPLPGQQFLRVESNEKPKEVVHNTMLFIEVDDILDWSGFCSRLIESRNTGTQDPSKRIWELLPANAQELIQNAAQSNGHGKAYKLGIVDALNDILDCETFYQEAYFRNVKITTEAENLFQLKPDRLSYNELRRLNRLLLEASYPNEINKSIKGCSYYHSTLAPPDSFVDLDNLEYLEKAQSDQVESVLEYMESLGPRQREQAQLIRLIFYGNTVAEIGQQIGKQPNTIRKELHGREKNGEQSSHDREMQYHQAGAVDIFQSIYNNRYFDLERKEKTLWAVVHKRDFSADPVLPPFRKIAHNFSISKRESIERYVKGWNWIKALANKGDNGMPKIKGNGSKNGTEPKISANHIAGMNKVIHPDYHALLTYAEGALNLDARKLIAGHVLICGYCAKELKEIEMKTLPAMERPLSLSERLRWLMARLTGRIHLTSDESDRSDRSQKNIREITRGSRWPLPVQMALGLAVVTLLSMLILLKAQLNRLDNQLAYLTSEKRELEEKNNELHEQTKDAERAGIEAQRLKDRNADLEREIYRLRDRNETFEKSLKSGAAPTHNPLTIIDTAGAIVVGSKVQTILPKDNSQSTNPEPSVGAITLSESQAEPVREYAAVHDITLAESARKAWRSVEKIVSAKSELARGGNDSTKIPNPISPNRTAIRSTGPTLRWEPVPGAKSYRINISDMTNRNADLIEQDSEGTQFTLDAGTLQPGHVYRWYVETRLDSQLTSQPIISPAAGFWVLEEKVLREIETVDQNFKPMALMRAIMYSKYGLYEEALRQAEMLKRNEKPVQKIKADLRRRLGRKQPK